MIAPKRVLPKTSLPKAALAQRKTPTYSNLPKKPLMTRGRVIALISLLMVTCVAAAWFTGLIGPDPRLAELRDLRAKAEDQSLSEKDRQAARDEMRKKWEELPEDVRQKMIQERMKGGGPGGPRMRFGGPGVSPAKLLAMPEDQRNAALDKMIDDQQKRMQEMAKNGNNGPGGPGGAGRGPGGPGGFGGGPNNQRRNSMLSSVPAESRATWTIMRELTQARRIQRGMQ